MPLKGPSTMSHPGFVPHGNGISNRMTKRASGDTGPICFEET